MACAWPSAARTLEVRGPGFRGRPSSDSSRLEQGWSQALNQNWQCRRKPNAPDPSDLEQPLHGRVGPNALFGESVLLPWGYGYVGGLLRIGDDC